MRLVNSVEDASGADVEEEEGGTCCQEEGRKAKKVREK